VTSTPSGVPVVGPHFPSLAQVTDNDIFDCAPGAEGTGPDVVRMDLVRPKQPIAGIRLATALMITTAGI
jgi:hypothetical protein